MTRYAEVLETLRAAYDRGAGARNEASGMKEPWKLAERDAFLARLCAEGRQTLLEIGAGTGQDSVFFQDHGLEVVATDLSPQMVESCRAKGVNAHVRDFLDLGFPEASFDAAYALNCLLHVPNADIAQVLGAIRAVLRPRSLFFMGVYGGEHREGPVEYDYHVPPRFFSLRTDEEIQDLVRPHFEILDFHVVPLKRPGFHFQSLTLRRPA